LRNGKAAADVTGGAGKTPSEEGAATRALESAVLDLLKPMLRQWLDQNMPRLVAEALKDEAARVRATGGEGRKA